MHIRQVITAALIATTTALGGCKTTGGTVASNQSPYTSDFLNEDLMEGRVEVFSFRPRFDDPWHVHGAVWYARYDVGGDIERLICQGERRQYAPTIGRSEMLPGDGEPEPRAAIRHGDGHASISPAFYNPRTGRFHNEYHHPRRGWTIFFDGWIQESWPRLMADACPELTERIVAAGVPINEAQTSPYIWRMLAQDPDAPYTLDPDEPGGDVTERGAAASRSGAPFGWWHLYGEKDVPEPAIKGWPFDDELSAATPEDAFIRTLAEGHGKVFTDPIGRAYVLSVHPEGDELWAIDDADQLLDVGHLRFDADTREVVLDWETLPPARGYRHRIGEPLPVVNTGRTHPAFDLAHHLVGLDRDHVLPFHGRDVTFRLNPDGTLLARRPAGDIPGTWRVSRGRLVLQVDGIPDRAGYQWALLAAHLGLTEYAMPDA